MATVKVEIVPEAYQLYIVERGWSEYAGEPITIKWQPGWMYALGSELAVLRLLQKFRNMPAGDLIVEELKHLGCWQFGMKFELYRYVEQADPMIYRNKNFVKRDYERTNIVACKAIEPPDENWEPSDETILEKLTQLWSNEANGKQVTYYGYL